MTDHDKRVVEWVKEYLKQFFDLKLEELTSARNQTFWALGVNSSSRTFRDLIGNVDAPSMAILNQHFQDADAGFKADAQTVLPIKTHADIFLINEDHIHKSQEEIGPMIVHEVCHFIEQTGAGRFVSINDVDKTNAKRILDSYHPPVRAIHTMEWAELMAWAARRAVERHGATSIADYLEKAIPSYDRPSWNRANIRES